MNSDKQAPFVFFDSHRGYDTAKAFYVRIDPGIALPAELLRALYYGLWFPGYFGFNWNALYDCLTDLEWISCRKVIIAHEGMPALADSELRVYLEVLRDATLNWGEGREHKLEILFREVDRGMIERFLDSGA
ncbi:barstar family protein [Pseudomonas mosselii]|uniref:Barstar family protein n=1 Tax=Pseudomonas mosselii TaxID=78327 RepID=A0ABX9ATQ0_9PSED|nr:barstar family protein [Pseudomonas mosselii]MBH3311833.1 barstar family protein [Pseudomonas mosselii]MBH3326098.1 barstar family protein [Pseudomonas mosselii]MCL8302763.1 barstar family protein [Pseudomonas mosselii]MCL8342995.1 barstar family protein [Pseudomonas mosselii]MCU9532122.1 barstar family protein [Pseudomonas mosselii]